MTPRFTRMEDDPVTVARRLLGQRLVRKIDGQRLAGIIVEVEAYLGAPDRASHTYGGRRTLRNEAMYLPGGHGYVYFTYGMHHCLNVVCGAQDEGVAVLIRALEPVEGIAQMFATRRQARLATELCSGPGKLTHALRIDHALNGEDLRSSDRLCIEQVRSRALSVDVIERTARIGLNPRMDRPPDSPAPKRSNADTDAALGWSIRPLRFFIRHNPHVSGRKSESGLGRIRSS